nr:uncharacterized protein LOC109740286 isoform X2 [Aegilops tauschii subsp. strangulata]
MRQWWRSQQRSMAFVLLVASFLINSQKKTTHRLHAPSPGEGELSSRTTWMWMLMLLHWASSKGTTGLEIVISTLGREGQEAACTLLNEMLLPTTNSPDARYWFPLEQMNYIVTLNYGDMFPQSSLDKSNSTGSPVRQVLPVAMSASWPIEENMPVS